MPIHLKKVLFFIFLLSSFLQDAQAAATDNIYAYTQAGMLAPGVKNALFRVYVPNGNDGTVTVIDPLTYQVIQTFVTGKDPQHVVPSYDLKTLWVLNNKSNTLTPVDPATAKPGASVPVDDPYNLYFTPDGKFAIVVCEGRNELQFRDPQTMKLVTTLAVKCNGANHMEFTHDGRYAIVSCEFSGQLLKVDLQKRQVTGYLSLGINNQKVNTKTSVSELTITSDGKVIAGTDSQKLNMNSMPQDIRSSANGSVFFVADMMKDGLVLIDPVKFIKVGFIRTGMGTHGIYPSRDGKYFYVSNRGCHQLSCGPHGPGSVSVVDPDKKRVVATWSIPQGGSPDMGNITPDGKELWLAGRYDHEVYVFNTVTGELTHRIRVGSGPHGLAVWPQPGEIFSGAYGEYALSIK